MQCKNCGFSVPQNLKFAIMKNFCPQCGNKLFSEREMNHLATIQNRVSGQDFAKKFTEQQVHDISLFLYNEISSGYGRVIIDEYLKEILKNKKVAPKVETSPKIDSSESSLISENDSSFDEDGEGEELNSDSTEDDDSVEEDDSLEDNDQDFDLDQELENVKSRIREEEAARVALSHEAGGRQERRQDEDQESKINRLKELHKNSMLKPRNPVVRRIDS